MPLNIVHSVIHGFNKEKQGPVTHVVKRPVLLDNSLEAVKLLIAGLSGLLGKKSNSQAWGRFGNDGREGPIPAQFGAYALNLPDQNEFLRLSHSAVDQLVEQAGKESFSTGGRILFSMFYDEGGSPTFLVAMIKQKGGLVLDDNFVPIGIVEVDLSKLHQAAQIKIDHFLDDQAIGDVEDDDLDRNYLSFLSPRSSSQASNYFIDALGCVVGISSAKATDQVYAAVNAYFSANAVLAPHRKQAKEKVSEYLQRQMAAGQPATLDDICSAIRQSAPPEFEHHFEEVLSFLNGPKYKIPDEFNVHSGSLKKHVKVSLDNDRLNLKFPRSDLGTTPEARIGYNKEQRTLTIRQLSDEFVAKLDQTLTNG